MHVMIVSPYIAPFTGVGALRMTSLTKFLLANEVEVSVVKLKDSCYGNQVGDEKLLGRLFEFEREEQLQDTIEHACEVGQIDCCIVSGGPFYTMKPTERVCTQRNIPLIVDYRDFWLNDPRRKRHTLRAALGQCRQILKNRAVERRIMRNCAAFVTVTPRYEFIMKQSYPEIRRKSYCIYNGYTPVEGLQHVEHTMEGKAEICILGKLGYYDQQKMRLFFKAVRELLDEGLQISVVHIGPEEEGTQKVLHELGLPVDILCEKGQMPYEQAMKLAEKSDIYVSIENSGGGLATKVFDYIYLNKPIVVVVSPDNEYSTLLEKADNGFVCSTLKETKQALRTIIVEKRNRLSEDSGYVSQFSRKTQNTRYLQLLRQITGVDKEDMMCLIDTQTE